MLDWNGKMGQFRVLRIVLLIALVALLSGCASFEGKFSKTRNADIGLFADQTVSMLSDDSLGLDSSQAIYIRDFVDPTSSALVEFVGYRDRVNDGFVTIVKYSLKLVEITEGYPTEEGRIQAYADYLESFDNIWIEALKLTPDHYAALITEVREQEKFLTALQVAQPIINAAGRYMQQQLNLLENVTGLVVAELEAAIDAEFADIVSYQRTLHDEKYALLKGVEQLYLAGTGNKEAFEQLKESGIVRDSTLLPAGLPDYQQSTAIGSYFKDQFGRVGFIEKEIQADWDLYRASHRELDQLDSAAEDSINGSRVVMIVWLRAHQKMASGKINPAAWFDVSDAPATLFQIGKKAIL